MQQKTDSYDMVIAIDGLPPREADLNHYDSLASINSSLENARFGLRAASVSHVGKLVLLGANAPEIYGHISNQLQDTVVKAEVGTARSQLLVEDIHDLKMNYVVPHNADRLLVVVSDRHEDRVKWIFSKIFSDSVRTDFQVLVTEGTPGSPLIRHSYGEDNQETKMFILSKILLGRLHPNDDALRVKNIRRAKAIRMI